MANPDDIVGALTLELTPDRVPAAIFGKVVAAFVKSLDAIAAKACGNAGAVQWEISVDRGSARLAADPGEASAPGAARSVRRLIDNEPETVRGSFVPPPGMPEAYIRIGRERRPVARVEGRERDGPWPFDSYGTVEGELEVLDSKPPPRFTIREPIWNKSVQCRVPDDLVARMPSMWGRRVAAHGLIHYNAEGHPVSIEAEDIEPFPHDETPIEAFRGILAGP